MPQVADVVPVLMLTDLKKKINLGCPKLRIFMIHYQFILPLCFNLKCSITYLSFCELDQNSKYGFLPYQLFEGL